MKVKVLNKVGVDGVQYDKGNTIDITKEDYDIIMSLDDAAGREPRIEKIKQVRKKQVVKEDNDLPGFIQ